MTHPHFDRLRGNALKSDQGLLRDTLIELRMMAPPAGRPALFGAHDDVADAPSLNRVIRLTNGKEHLKLACIHAAWEPQHEKLKKRNLGLPLTHRRFTRARAAPVQADFRFVSCVLWLFLIAVDPATAVAVAFLLVFRGIP